MRAVLVLFVCIVWVNAEELMLDDLLKEYAQSEELYLKTKRENAGHLAVYSREDLEQMQAHTLKDVLKTVRMFTLQTNPRGLISFTKAAQGQMSVTPTKLYINDYELISLMHGNILSVYGDMDIYFIDHIEVYWGGASIALGNERGSIVIRLYTKDPTRENSQSVQLSVDSKSGANLRGVDAGTIGEYTYLVYADRAKNRYETYARNGHELSRDGERFQFHLGFSQKGNFEIDAGGMFNKVDIFNGLGTAPAGGETKYAHSYVNAIKYFPHTFKAALSISTETQDIANRDDNGIVLADGSMSNELNIGLEGTTYKAKLEKQTLYGKSDLLMGVQWVRQDFDVNRYESDGIDKLILWGPKKLDIYMVYAEELYNINENHLVALGSKLDHYRDNFSQSSNEYTLNIGYTALFNESWTFKAFGVRRYQYPNVRQQSFAPNYDPNPELTSTKTLTATGELIYHRADSKVFFGFGYGEARNSIAFSAAENRYINQDTTGHFRRVYVRGEHIFNLENKVIVECYKLFKDQYASPRYGALIQLFNTLGPLDIYNELVYRAGYSVMGMDMDEGYDYTLGVIYPVSKQLQLKLKGENLLGRATEIPIGPLEVPALERRVSTTVEYTF